MREIYILIHGQIRSDNDATVYTKNIEVFQLLKKNKIIKDVVISTFVDTYSTEIKKKSGFIYIEYPTLSNTGHGNWIAQMNNYEHGIKYIRSIAQDVNNTFVFKGRPDAATSYAFITHIFKKQLSIPKNNGVFRHKIWIPWAEMTKPMYFGDELFFGHIDDMDKMYNYNQYSPTSIGQGVTHIRRFIDPFIKEYPILEDYIQNKHLLSTHIMIIPDFSKLQQDEFSMVIPYFKELMKVYYHILMTYFDVETQPNHLVFRVWSNLPLEERVDPDKSFAENNTQLCNISRKMICFNNMLIIGNIKHIYSNECVKRIYNSMSMIHESN